jgi:hypothetical protein
MARAMRPPTILDLIQAVTQMAPSYPEVAVWWYARATPGGAPRVLLVLEPRSGAVADAAGIDAELAGRFGPEGVTVRMHRGASEAQTLYRLLTGAAPRKTAAHAEGS